MKRKNRYKLTSGMNELTVAMFGIASIVILETIALLKGINGTMFGSAMAGIGGIAGYLIKSHIKEK